MSENQYGFTPQTSAVDAVMALKDFMQNSLHDGQYVTLIYLDVKGAFDEACWPSILTSPKTVKCRRNLCSLCVSYFNERSAIVLLNSSIEQEKN